MPNLDAQKDVRLDIGREFIEKEFGGTIQLTRKPGDCYLTAWHVKPAEGQGAHVIACNAEANNWFEVEDGEAFVSITYDGKVFFAYPEQDPAASGMCFLVGHPREAAELLHLLVHPRTCTAPVPEGESACRTDRLGDLFAVKALLPCGKDWKMLDLSAANSGEPDGCRRMVLAAMMGHGGQDANTWGPEAESLPDASPALRTGYVMDNQGGIDSAVDVAAFEPDKDKPFAKLLLIPILDDVSYLLIREFLTCDARLREAIKKVFDKPASMDDLVGRLATIEITLPARLHHQIRKAAELISWKRL